MEDTPLEREVADPPGNNLVSRLANMVEIVLVAVGGFVLIPLFFSFAGIQQSQILEEPRYLGAFLGIESTVTLLLVAMLLRLRGQGLGTLQPKDRRTRRELWLGCLVVPLFFLSTILTSLFFQNFLPEYLTDRNPLLELVQTPEHFAILLLLSIYSGGIKEEVQRAFVLLRFGENLGGAGFGLLVWSVFFGYGHLIQGPDKAVAAGLLGLGFGLLYLWRGHLVAPIVAHALYDILTLTLYWSAFTAGI